MEAGGLLPHQPSQGPPGIVTGPGNNLNNSHCNSGSGGVGSIGGGGIGGGVNNNNIGLTIQQHQHQQLQINRVRNQQQQQQNTNHQNLEHLNSANQLNLTNHQQQQLQQLQQQMGQAPGMGDILTPKKQQGVDRLRRRMDNYRKRQVDCAPRFDQSFNGICEQNMQDTLVLKQRFLESKAKRQPKKTDKKQNETVGLSNVHVLYRIVEEAAVSHINS